MKSTYGPAILLLSALLSVGCATTAKDAGLTDRTPVAATVDTPETADPLTPGSFENLHAALWTATSVEFRALTLQTYRNAARALDRGLADTSWTASLEQVGMKGMGMLPPAVVLDVDETVLDNSAYQARLIDHEASYESSTWKAWVQEAAADPVPGALTFTQYAQSRGVQVIYLTNRDADGEEATRRNLEAFGFPLASGPDAVLTQGEIPEWRPSDKGPRRSYVADRYRILLLVGDNLGDFLSDGRVDLEGRDQLFETHEAWWGERWIVLPNPQYGSWETATFDHDYSLSPVERLARKRALIRQHAGSDR